MIIELRAAFPHADIHSGYKLAQVNLLTFGPFWVLSIYFLAQHLGSELFKMHPKYKENYSRNHCEVGCMNGSG